MGLTAAIVGAIGGLCAIVGIIAAAEVIPLTMPQQFSWMFWFALSALLLLGSIAFALGRGSYE